MAWRTFQSRVRRGPLTLALAAAFTISCGEGTGPVPLEPMIGALQVSAASPSGWGFFEEVPNASGSYVAGPTTPPLGFGSARFVVDATGRLLLGTVDYAGVRLDQITSLQYQTFVPSGQPAALAVTLQLDIDYDLTDPDASWQGRLVFEPPYTAAVNQGSWQIWNPLAGKWWASGAPGNTVCTQAAPCDWTAVLAAFPKAGLRKDVGVLQFKAGGPWAPGFTGYVDAFRITAAGESQVFDFEPSLEPCAFEPAENARRVRLTANCTTDHTLYIPNGWTLDGAGYTITAQKPGVGDFLGAVLRNGGSRAHVRNVRILGDFTGSGGCHGVLGDGTDERLRGILFDGASGSILFSKVENILRAPHYGCQEGNGIEVRNAPYNGEHPNTQEVLIQQNTVLRYQKTGILANGDVRVVISGNDVSSAATAAGENLDDYIAANSIQIGFGAAHATIQGNRIQGNDWDGPSYWSGTAILVYYANDVEIASNDIGSASPSPRDEQTDIGVYAEGSGVVNVMGNFIGRRDEDETGKGCEEEYVAVPPPTPPELVRPLNTTLGVYDCDPDGIGVYFLDNSGISKVVSNRFTNNWNQLQMNADRDHHNRVAAPIH